MYVCIHTYTHTHTHRKFFFNFRKEGAVWPPECEGEKTLPQYPWLPPRRCRNWLLRSIPAAQYEQRMAV